MFVGDRSVASRSNAHMERQKRESLTDRMLSRPMQHSSFMVCVSIIAELAQATYSDCAQLLRAPTVRIAADGGIPGKKRVCR